MLGALGACFGRVVTIDSPKARPPGTFNWGETLWHEMAHVITLQLSNNRLPRWLSEGTSTYEERRARKEWGRDMDIPFARFLDQRQGAEDPRSQFRVQQLADDFVRVLPGVVARRAHCRHLRPAEAARARGGVCGRQRYRGGDQEGARHRHRRAPEELRRHARQALREPAAGAEGAGGPGARAAARQDQGHCLGQPGELCRADDARRSARRVES